MYLAAGRRATTCASVPRAPLHNDDDEGPHDDHRADDHPGVDDDRGNDHHGRGHHDDPSLDHDNHEADDDDNEAADDHDDQAPDHDNHPTLGWTDRAGWSPLPGVDIGEHVPGEHVDAGASSAGGIPRRVPRAR